MSVMTGRSSGYGHSECCPPVLDPYTLLGLTAGIALATYFLRNVITTTTFTPPKRKKREDDSLETDQRVLEGLEEFEPEGDQCLPSMWRCVSGVMEGMVKTVGKEQSIFKPLARIAYKVTFHGRKKNIWTSVMSLPEVRAGGRCLRDHDSCVSHSILAGAVKHSKIEEGGGNYTYLEEDIPGTVLP